MNRVCLVLLGILLCFAQSSAADTPLLPIRNARVPLQGVLSGGQPTPEQIAAAAKGGFATVISLRTDPESGHEWEREAVEAAGMQFVQIPIAGADGLTRDNVARIDEALTAAMKEGPVLFHCASGNRIGAALALRAGWVQEASTDDAMKLGLAGGVTRLEQKTRELLQGD